MQREDTSLQKYWDMVGRPDNRYVIMGDKKLLYRTTKIRGLTVYQLLTPKGKRKVVISKAHETELVGHGGVNKIVKRLETQFWWPKVRSRVAKFIKSCESCQSFAKKTKQDKTPRVPCLKTQRAWSQVSNNKEIDQKKSVQGYMAESKQDLEIEARVALESCTV